jgi:hypothetical protein
MMQYYLRIKLCTSICGTTYTWYVIILYAVNPMLKPFLICWLGYYNIVTKYIQICSLHTDLFRATVPFLHARKNRLRAIAPHIKKSKILICCTSHVDSFNPTMSNMYGHRLHSHHVLHIKYLS